MKSVMQSVVTVIAVSAMTVVMGVTQGPRVGAAQVRTEPRDLFGPDATHLMVFEDMTYVLVADWEEGDELLKRFPYLAEMLLDRGDLSNPDVAMWFQLECIRGLRPRLTTHTVPGGAPA